MIQLHSPDYSIFDVRSCSPQQLSRTFATIANLKSGQAILICIPNQLTADRIPHEISTFCRIIDLSNHDENYYELVEAILSPSEKAADITSERKTLDPSSTFESATEASIDAAPPLNAKHPPSGGDEVEGSSSVGRETKVPAIELEGMADRFRTRTPELRTMLRRLEIAARHNVTILLIGETGSGKTHLASLIHEMSLRSRDPFLHVACGALPGELIESELFGHVKGSFTSAHADKDGKFLVAGNGTILLDEIDVLTPDQQVKLLRVIETGEFEPVGSNRTLTVKARIIAASNLQLQPLVEQGRFRPDLYYRLNTLSFTLPPLRKRMPDIEPLARYFVHRHATQLGIEVMEITPEFLECLHQYPWPGNVREMENAIRSAVIYSREGRMTPDTLPTHVVDCISGPANDPSVAAFFAVRKGESLENRIELTEKDIIEQALLNNNFSRTNTAKHLKISRVTLYNKMRKYGIMPER
ncbi:MAG: sigma-54-dependent Fis family transcriptional regulator [Planctomycetaceae bacterium]|nr:sigma-54-dependent Fis family transcriptional regulator [Planctomycetaceae bacterium]